MGDHFNATSEPPDYEPGYLEAFETGKVFDASDRFRAGREPAADASPPPLPQDALEFPNDGREPRAVDSNQIIKGLIVPRSQGSVVGPSGAGKTTACIELGFRIALGQDYHGLKVPLARPVLYVNYEGSEGFQNRAAAAYRTYGDPGTMFARFTLTPTLNRSDDGAKGAELVIQAAREFERINGQTVGLIFIDTKARATAGDDENSASDAANYLEHRGKRIAEATGAAVVTVHHTGKNADLGGRGSSALPAGDDFRLLIDNERNVTVDKARDGKSDYVLFSYELEQVELRVDEDGDPITACVIKSRSGEAKRTKALPKQTKRALEMLVRLFNDGHGKSVAASEIDLQGIEPHRMPLVVEINLWRKKCAASRLAPEGKEASEQKAFKRAVEVLEAANRVCRYGDYVWLLNGRHSGQDGTNPDNVRACPTGWTGQNGHASMMRPNCPAPEPSGSLSEGVASQYRYPGGNGVDV